jgi:hypothetical protein
MTEVEAIFQLVEGEEVVAEQKPQPSVVATQARLRWVAVQKEEATLKALEQFPAVNS